MSQLAAAVQPTALFALGVLVLVGISFATLWLFVLRPRRRSRDPGLLREPARSLRRRLETVNHRMTGAGIGAALALSLWTVFLPSALSAVEGIQDSVIFAAAGVVALGWFARELLQLWPERIGLLRAIEVQTRTGQSLNLLMRQKYWVFHDVHLGGHRINHLVIGPRGVFCVDTFWRRVRGRLTWRGLQPPPSAEAVFDGERLRFPGWDETESFEELEMQAEWLGGWLPDRAGEREENVPTYAAIALPGWRVTSTHWKRLIVFNPSTPNMLIQGAPEGPRLDTTTTRALLEQLKRHCSDPPEALLRGQPSPMYGLQRLLRRLLRRERAGSG